MLFDLLTLDELDSVCYLNSWYHEISFSLQQGMFNKSCLFQTMQIDMYFRTLWRDERLKSTFEFLVTDNSSNYYIDSQREKERKAEKNREASTSTSSSQGVYFSKIPLGEISPWLTSYSKPSLNKPRMKIS